MSEIRRVNTGDAPRNVYHAGDAPRTVNTGRTVKTGSALNQDEYEAARRRAQQLAANNTRRTRSFNRVQQTDVDRYRAAQQKEQEARAAAAQQQAKEAHAAREAAARQQPAIWYMVTMKVSVVEDIVWEILYGLPWQMTFSVR